MRTIFRFFVVAVALVAVSLAGSSPQASSVGGPAAQPSASPTPSGLAALHAPAPSHEPPKRELPRAVVSPARTNPDPLHPGGDLIEVSLAKQRLTAWRDGGVVYRFRISTGRPGYETPAGHYAILGKYKNYWSRKWSVWMPWAMRWHEGYFIHQLPHKDGSSYNIGATKLGTADSHGCVRVDVGDAEILFRWTAVGTPVWVH